jgi:hypothetical protein
MQLARYNRVNTNIRPFSKLHQVGVYIRQYAHSSPLTRLRETKINISPSTLCHEIQENRTHDHVASLYPNPSMRPASKPSVRLWQFGFDAARSSIPSRNYLTTSCCFIFFLLFKPLQVSRDVMNMKRSNATVIKKNLKKINCKKSFSK